MSPPRDAAGTTYPATPANFLALPPELSSVEEARVALIPVPYDGTTSYRPGARDGPQAILRASHQLEEFDPELGYEPCHVGIHTAPEIPPHLGSPQAMVTRVAEAVAPYVSRGLLVGLLGGEHTIAVGSVRAMVKTYPDLSVLYLDAHADLRDCYQDTPYSHACVARRILEMCPVVEVGVRALSTQEQQFLQEAKGLQVFSSGGEGTGDWGTVVQHLSRHVYISVDLDVLDPSIMAAVGTPEPGGMGWRDVLGVVWAVARERRVVGFDVSELAPREGPEACAYAAAKLAYKLIAYATTGSDRERER